MNRGGRGRGRGGGRREAGSVQSQETSSVSGSEPSVSESSGLSLSTDLEEELTQLQLSSSQSFLRNNNLLPPQQRSKKLFPGLAKTGRSTSLKTNHFSLKVSLPQGVVHMYEVTIVAPWTRAYRETVPAST